MQFIDETLKDSISFWVKTKEKKEFQDNFSLEENLLKLKKLRIYLSSLNSYGVDALAAQDINKMKRLLTLSPDMETRLDHERLDKFIADKIKNIHRVHSEAIFKVHRSFYTSYPPVTTPILHKFKLIKQQDVFAVIFGFLLVMIYLLMTELFISM